ncbi:mannose-6-phosphate isomerase [Dysgonomonadaceae bacterium PH5-43]|nr:mannose-6-phosphate isomerase [Dysgonomonadaceae bacterium PH5-43]
MDIFKFKPILKPIVWGGNKIANFKNLDIQIDKIGESWEISAMPDNESIVAEGEYKGKTLNELIDTFKSDLLGKKVYEQFGGKFPLLVKFIDADKDLSIQVHPDDELANERHNCFGKTEMWYVVQACQNAFVYSGFAKEMTPEQYDESIKNNTFTDYLNKEQTEVGDVFAIPAGRVHSISAGNFLLEVQQSSDITYRIYDYDRKDKEGNVRKLHTEEAKDAIDFSLCSGVKEQLKKTAEECVLDNEFFKVSTLEYKQGTIKSLEFEDTFVIIVCIKGSAMVRGFDGVASIAKGETILIPAKEAKSIFLEVQEDATLLAVTC